MPYLSAHKHGYVPPEDTPRGPQVCVCVCVFACMHVLMC